MRYEAELAAALQAAERASQLIRKQYVDFQAIPDAPSNITTEVDRQSQALIIASLQEVFPQDAFCAEESNAAGSKIRETGPRLWIIDPIDGTRGFVMKNGEFSVMIGFLDQGQLAVGVVQEPGKDRVTWAARDHGCWYKDAKTTTPTRCRVSTVKDLASSALVQSHAKNPKVPSAEVQALKPARIVETYSAGVKLAMVARGEVELYVNNYPNFFDWDIAAGDILVTEAGGKVTGLHGQELHYGQPGAPQRLGLLGTNGLVHAEAVQRLEAVK